MTEKRHFVAQDTGVAIDSTGQIARQELFNATTVSLNIEGTATADYALDVSPDGDNWFDAEESYSGTDIRDTFEITDRAVRVRVTSAATGGATADVTIQGVR